jgi:hypothetical protein bfra3_07207
MTRTLSIKQAYLKKFKTYPFTGVWHDIFGQPETTGAWIIHGDEKQGKSTFALMLANYLTSFGKVLYISAEEGISMHFVATMQRLGLSDHNRRFNIQDGYQPWEDIETRLDRRQCPKIVVIDNLTKYRDEVTKKQLNALLDNHRDKLIIMVSHEERGLPDTAQGRLWRKLSKVIVRVEGLKAFITGRCPGGELLIDEDRAMLYHGCDPNTKNIA